MRILERTLARAAFLCAIAILLTPLRSMPTVSAAASITQPVAGAATQAATVKPTVKAEVRLNRVIYTAGSAVTATVTLMPGVSMPAKPVLVFAGTVLKDAESVPLKATDNPRVWITSNPLPVILGTSATAAPRDGRLTLTQGERFFALFSLIQSGTPAAAAAQGPGNLVSAFGVMKAVDAGSAPVKVMPQLAMTDDERKPPAGGKPLGTLATPHGAAVQVPIDELVIYPRDQLQLDQFLAESGGKVVTRSDAVAKGTGPTGYLVLVDPARADLAHLPQLRALDGEKTGLLASNVGALRIYSLALQYRMEGYVVGVNPRLQYMDDVTTQDDTRGAGVDVTSSNPSQSPPLFSDPVFGVQKAWAFLALWDRDTQRIPMGILDMGFAPNPDFRGFPHSIPQRDMVSGRSGDGAAAGPPTVGNSFFGAPSWHGTGVVETAAGVLNNGWGTAGTGGQVVQPMLYRMDLRTYAFEEGLGIEQAVNDGATIINISAGYPCNVVTNVGIDFEVCNPLARAAFCTGVAAATHVAAGAAVLIPFVGPIIAAIATAAADAATTACFATLIVGDPRGPMQDGVDFAHQHGVTVVSIAGNQQTSDSLGALCDVIPCGPQDAGRWQVVPCTLDGVICAGAANDTSPYSNQEFFGSRVDVWAPIHNLWFHPADPTTLGDPLAQIKDSERFNGTSAAAPYVAGIAAMMEAVNPALDPRTSTLTPAQRQAIPAQIRSILMSTATPASALPFDPQRRNLVNAFRAVKQASQGFIPNFDLRGYDTSLGLQSAPSDHDVGNPVMVDALAGGNFTDTILSIPRDVGPGGITYADEDWYLWQTPDTPGVYSGGTVELTFPTNFGALRINDQPGTLVGRSADGLEEIRRFQIPAQFENASFPLKVSGFLGTDNVYKLHFMPAVRTGDHPQPDRFDVPGGNPAGCPNNDTDGCAVPLGVGDLGWQHTPAPEGLTQTWSIPVSGLNIDHPGDLDWFSVTPPDDVDFTPDTQCPDASPYLTIGAGMGTMIDVFASDGSLIQHSVDGIVQLGAARLHGRLPLRIRVSSATGGPVNYDLQVTVTLPSSLPCLLQGHTHDDFPLPGSRVFHFNPGDPDPNANPGDRFQQFGSERSFLLNWHAKDRFTLLGQVQHGQSVHLSLTTLQGKSVAEAATSNVAAKFPGAIVATTFDRTDQLVLSTKSLTPGTYVLSVDAVTVPTLLDLALPQGAISDQSLSLETRTQADAKTPGELLLAGMLPNK